MLLSDLIENAYHYHKARGKLVWARETWRVWKQHISPILGDLPADKFTTKHQELYRSTRTEQGVKPSTVNREMQILRRAYKLGAQHEPAMVERVPHFIMAPLNDARKVFIDMDTLGRIRQEASRHSAYMRAAVEIGYTYGWRRGEVIKQLHVRDVDLLDGSIRLQTSKNGEAREVPIPDTLVPFLKPLLKDRQPEDKLIPVTEGTFVHQWKLVRKAAGALRYRFHDFRRTSAKIKRKAGVPTSVIMEMQGWKTEAMFRRYAIVDRDDKVDALRRQAELERRLAATAV